MKKTPEELSPDQKEERVYNNTSASLNSSVIPDEDRVAKYDLYYKRDNKGMAIKGFLMFAFLGACLYFLVMRQWLFAILSLVLFALVLWRASLKDTGVPVDVAYRYGLLIPAMIVQEKPLEMVAMANIRADGGKPQFACKKIEVGRLDPHTIRLNEKIPCATMFKCARDGMWTNFEPRPIAWASSDIRVLQDDVSAIDQEDWDFLRKVKHKAPDMEEDQIALFDESGEFKELFSCHHSEKR